MNTIKVIIEKTNTGYSAYVPQEKEVGLVTSGRSFEEIKENFAEVLELAAEYFDEKDKPLEAERLRKATVEYALDMEQFFEHFYMINKSAFAKFIGMNESQMRKLSSGIISLSDKKALQIQDGLHTLAKDLGSVHFV